MGNLAKSDKTKGTQPTADALSDINRVYWYLDAELKPQPTRVYTGYPQNKLNRFFTRQHALNAAKAIEATLRLAQQDTPKTVSQDKSSKIATESETNIRRTS